jgi:hypothetical protein
MGAPSCADLFFGTLSKQDTAAEIQQCRQPVGAVCYRPNVCFPPIAGRSVARGSFPTVVSFEAPHHITDCVQPERECVTEEPADLFTIIGCRVSCL